MVMLQGAHVLVVGATGGLGTPISRELAAQGAVLTLSGRSTERLGRAGHELGPQVLGVAAGDLLSPGVPDQLVAEAHARQPLLGVVFAAGVVAFGEIGDLDDDVLDQLVLVNLMAPIRIARAAVAVLPAGGFLATISAVVAEQPMKGMAAYSAVKAGLTAFDAAAAAELRRRNIRVLDIRPTHTETGLANRPIGGASHPGCRPAIHPIWWRSASSRRSSDDERDLPAAAFG